MTLADRLKEGPTRLAAPVARAHKAPTGFEPGIRYVDNRPAEVTLQLREIPEDEQAWRKEIKRVTQLDIPEHRRVEIQQVRYWGDPREPQIYVRFGIVDRAVERGEIDLPGLLQVVKQNRRPRPSKRPTPARTRVGILSDVQAHKVDHRGGTRELLQRLDAVFARYEDECKRVRCDDALVLDPGDLIEGFENTAQQAYTNDGSLPDQLDTAQVIVADFVGRTAALHRGGTRVATVPSNHGAWRRGKGTLGKPGDDFGLMVHKAVARQYQFARRDDVTWVIPQPWDEALALQVRGAVIGLAHGHQAGANPDRVPLWWAKQTQGGTPLAAATILVTGHWHHFRAQPAGQIDGRDRWWLMAPTLDNGSAWWRNSAGIGDSEPALLTFTIGDDGRWDDLRLIRPDRVEEVEEP
ncbi:MAG TPA: hypothetical protein VKZ55_04455 [Microthrixaceae bacterium]|nr:hypothetical protein [Microthrixaceae bacterium]